MPKGWLTGLHNYVKFLGEMHGHAKVVVQLSGIAA